MSGTRGCRASAPASPGPAPRRRSAEAATAALRGGVSGFAVPAFVLAALCGGVLLARTGMRFRNVQRALHEGRPLDNRADAVLAWLGALAVAAGSLATVVHLA